MDEFTQAARDGNIDLLQQYRKQGKGNIKEAFYEALRVEQLNSIDYLLPYMQNSDLRRIVAEAKARRKQVIFEKINAFLQNPTTLPVKTFQLAFMGCMIPRDDFHKYEINYQRRLGEGGYGTVYVGRYRPNNLPVAVKIMHKINMHPHDVQLIQHECQILSQLDHPHIIKIYGGYEDDDAFYWMLSLMNGGSLDDYVQQHAQPSVAACTHLFRQLIAAVDYCHRHNIIHRDIKPENILLQDGLQIVLGDFGLAAYQAPGGLFTDYVGTASYQSPEIVLQRPYDGRAADIWAMGVTLYFMYFGKLPFNRPHLPFNILNLQPEYTGDAMSNYIQRILQKDPRDRPTIEELQIRIPTGI